MRTRAAAVLALAAVLSMWWLVGEDHTRSLGTVSVLIIAEPGAVILPEAPSFHGDDEYIVRMDVDWLADRACSQLSEISPSPTPLAWKAVVQPNGVRGCRLDQTWRVADLLAEHHPGEPSALLQNGVVTVTFDPEMVPPAATLTSLRVEAAFPGPVLTHSGSSSVTDTTVRWDDPADFLRGGTQTATAQDRPLAIAVLPWLAVAAAVASGFGWRPRRRAVDPLASADAADGAGSNPEPGVPVVSSWRAPAVGPGSRPEVGTPAERRPVGPDPHSPWRPPAA